MRSRIVIDTNVVIGALIGKKYGANRKLIELCFTQKFQPLISDTLFAEYEDVASRKEIIRKSPYSLEEVSELLDAFYSVSQWIKIYYLWRPNLLEEDDNYLVELAVAGNATAIITHNKKDFQNSQLKFPNLKIKLPQEII